MKVLIVNHVGVYSGAEKDAVNLINALDSEKYEIVFACPDGKLADQIGTIGIPLHLVPTVNFVRTLNPIQLAGYFGKLLIWMFIVGKIIVKEKIDVVQANSFIACLLVFAVAGLFGKPCLWHMHDILKPRLLNRVVVTLLSRLSAHTIAVSDAVRKNLISLGAEASRIEVIYNSLYSEQKVSTLTQVEAKEKIEVLRQQPVVGIIGQIAGWKGQDVFVNAIERYAESATSQTVSTQFLIVGDVISEHEQDFKADLLDKIKQVDNQSVEIRVLGFRDDPDDIMRALDILVHCSTWHDPLPTVLIEGLAHGCCIVASNVGGVPEIIVHEQSGLLYTAGDSQELADVFTRLLGSPSERTKFSQQALERLCAFEPKENLERFTKIYDACRG